MYKHLHTDTECGVISLSVFLEIDMVHFKNKQNVFWGIHLNERGSGKTIGWIKKKKGESGKRNVFLVYLKYHQFPHPTGNRLIPKGMMVRHLSFPTLQEAQGFATKQIAEGETRLFETEFGKRLRSEKKGENLI